MNTLSVFFRGINWQAVGFQALGSVFDRVFRAVFPIDQGIPAQTQGRTPEIGRSEGRVGRISLVGAGPGAADLLTLRAVSRLQEADVVFYDRLVDAEVLDLARPDAERVFVGKHVGAHAWPQDRINGVIVAEALKGRHVVRLKSGDPGIFGRATEELDAARSAGIPVDMVPGVTAASAAGSALGRSLTERGATNVLVLATGTGCADDPTPDSTRLSGPGTTTALYMAVRQADRIAANWMRQGLPATARVDVAVDVSKPSERHLETTVDTLVADLAGHGVTGCAILLVTWPKPVEATGNSGQQSKRERPDTGSDLRKASREIA